jgi:thiosulfate reductase cytochrome b subunit
MMAAILNEHKKRFNFVLLTTFVFWVLSLSVTVQAASPQAEQIFKQLSQTTLVRAKFEQQKKLVSLQKLLFPTVMWFFLKATVCCGSYSVQSKQTL